MRQKGGREKKEKIGKKDAKETGMRPLRNTKVPPTTTVCCQSD